MTDSIRGMDGDIELALADLATAVAWPPTPDLAGSVQARLRAPSPAPGRAGPLTAWGSRRPRMRWALLLAAILALLVAGLALGVRYGLDLLSIGFGPAPTIVATPAPNGTDTAVSPGPSAPTVSPALGVGLGLGRPIDLDEARTIAAFDILMPADLGAPAAVFDGGERRRGEIAMLYGVTPDLPPSALLGGAGLLITQNRGFVTDELARKVVASGGTVERVDVGGDPGYWLAGDPHWFWYLAADGTMLEETRRAVGNTLVWQRGDVLLRIEGAIELDRALAIAASMR